MNREELEQAIGKCAMLVKLTTAVANNAAHLVMLDGIDHAKRCKRFYQNVKGGKRVGWYFKHAMRTFDAYEHRLLHADVNRMFCVQDMPERVRRKYGDITDAEYFDFWRGTGGAAYARSKDMITSLWNKYRLSLTKHGTADAEHVAWVMTAQTGIEIACKVYDSALRQCEAEYGVRRSILEYVFGQFSLADVRRDWQRAMYMLSPDLEHTGPDGTDARNIEHGQLQLEEAWTKPATLFGSVSEAVDDYAEIFATDGFRRKVQGEIAEVGKNTAERTERT